MENFIYTRILFLSEKYFFPDLFFLFAEIEKILYMYVIIFFLQYAHGKALLLLCSWKIKFLLLLRFILLCSAWKVC